MVLVNVVTGLIFLLFEKKKIRDAVGSEQQFLE